MRPPEFVAIVTCLYPPSLCSSGICSPPENASLSLLSSRIQTQQYPQQPMSSDTAPPPELMGQYPPQSPCATQSPLIFSLERSTGNKCYMMSARALNITWGHDQRYWQWISLPDARFKEVAALKMVWWLDITGKINISLLSDDTLYAAYFRWNLDPYGFRQPVEASLVLAGTEHHDVQPSIVSLMQNPGSEQGQRAVLRSDDWYEVELGQFFKRRGDMGEIEMSLKETKRPFEKKGLIVHGIEIRPVLP